MSCTNTRIDNTIHIVLTLHNTKLRKYIEIVTFEEICTNIKYNMTTDAMKNEVLHVILSDFVSTYM